MDKRLLSNIHIVILAALLLLARGKNIVEPSSLSTHPNDTVTSYIPDERSALLGLKAGLSDPANLLSSWKGDDCCKWKGVHCSSRNNHVIKLDLPGHGCDTGDYTQSLGGNISSSLLGLRHLRHLNLSCNQFYGVQVPEFLGSLHKLRYIDLSMSLFSGRIPSQLGNLSNLRYLNLAWAEDIYSTDINWLSQLTSLEYLDLTSVNLSAIVHWVPVVNMLPSLKLLRLSACGLRNSSGSLQISNLTSLETLDLSFNSFNRCIADNWFWGLTSLKYLDISDNGFYGQFPNEIGNMTSIVKLDLSWNKLVGMIPSNLKNLPTKVEPLRNLKCLYLDNNMLTGLVPLWIGDLTKLTELDLSYNNLEGIIHEGHLSGLRSLHTLQLSNNSIALAANSTWVPPSSLTNILLQSCLLGPKFPLWLRWLIRLDTLDISHTMLSDTVPDWFWMIASTATAIDLSSNQLNGQIPVLPTSLHELDLSRNNFVGPLPLDFGAPSLRKLILFDNSISGTIPSSLCKLQSLLLLDISENKLTGSIPNCSVDTSTTNMTSMSILHLSLSNNNLSGEFPSFLQHCQQLIFLDLSQNHFFGTLPTWVGEKLPYLSFLRLRSNMFYGHIPEELMELGNLQYLDLAYNNIKGSIPNSILNYKWMILKRGYHEIYEDALKGVFSYGVSVVRYNGSTNTENSTVLTKGQEILYTGEIIYMVNLDLSCNNLTGDIPEEISNLVELLNLNLSWNTFSGNIPQNIGALAQLESLDLSHNELSGEIPASLSTLTFLSFLNLSYNNLAGAVPSGNQLQILDDQEYIYIGNPGLCGPPLSHNCSQPKPILANQEQRVLDILDELNDVVFSLFIAMGSGYTMGLWVVFCTFLFKRKWRINWYSVCDSFYDWVYVQVAVTWASWSREKTVEAENDS